MSGQAKELIGIQPAVISGGEGEIYPSEEKGLLAKYFVFEPVPGYDNVTQVRRYLVQADGRVLNSSHIVVEPLDFPEPIFDRGLQARKWPERVIGEKAELIIEEHDGSTQLTGISYLPLRSPNTGFNIVP